MKKTTYIIIGLLALLLAISIAFPVIFRKDTSADTPNNEIFLKSANMELDSVVAISLPERIIIGENPDSVASTYISLNLPQEFYSVFVGDEDGSTDYNKPIVYIVQDSTLNKNEIRITGIRSIMEYVNIDNDNDEVTIDFDTDRLKAENGVDESRRISIYTKQNVAFTIYVPHYLEMVVYADYPLMFQNIQDAYVWIKGCSGAFECVDCSFTSLQYR